MGHIYVDGHRLADLNREFEALPRSFFRDETKVVEHFRERTGGDIPHSLFCDWLVARYELAPSRFEHYHPRWGRWIEEAMAIRYAGPPHFPSSSRTVSSQPIGSGVAAVPEPSAWVMLAIGMIAITCWRFLKND